jgi:hypothetical protein
VRPNVRDGLGIDLYHFSLKLLLDLEWITIRF